MPNVTASTFATLYGWQVHAAPQTYVWFSGAPCDHPRGRPHVLTWRYNRPARCWEIWWPGLMAWKPFRAPRDFKAKRHSVVSYRDTWAEPTEHA